MPKRTRANHPRPAAVDVPVVGMREPCPCGSGKRYKACHGKLAHRAGTPPIRHRPFEGLAAEAGLVAMREVLPAATAPLRLAGPYTDQTALIATLLPYATSMMTTPGAVWIGAQTPLVDSDDPSRSLAYALTEGLSLDGRDTPPTMAPPPSFDVRLQDLLHPDEPLDLEVHDSFDFWRSIDPLVEPGALDRANEAVVPTARLSSVDGAYWCRLADRDQVRWVLPYDEDTLLDALARLRARNEDGLGDGTRLLGAFRAYGLLIPVWDLVRGTSPSDADEQTEAFVKRLTVAMEDTAPFTSEERRARAGLSGRQVTVR
jgi:Family of unknown function (DUF5926)/SEC-C motif